MSSVTTTTTGRIPRGPVTATLTFFNPPEDNSTPFQYVEAPPAGKPNRNFSDALEKVPLTDIRGSETDYTLDVQGFQAISSVPSLNDIDWNSDASVKEKYYPNVEALLLQHVQGASRIHLFDHTIRRTAPDAPRAPVTRVHIDQTPASALGRVSLHLPPEDADGLLKGRVRIINVWRPLNGAVESFPLAFADSSSVPDSALVATELRYPNRTGETAGVKRTEGQKWLYWSGVDDNERLFLQCFDTEKGARVPHCAFIDPRSTEESKPRESIEVRALVFGWGER